VGNPRGLAETNHNLAITFRDLGDLDTADRHERRAIEYAREAGDERLLAMCQVGRADLALRRGEARVAAAGAQVGATSYARLPDRLGEADALRLVGVARAALGEHALARTALDRAVELAEAGESLLIVAEAYEARARLAADLGDRPTARHEAALALARQLPDGKTLDQFLKPGVWKNLDFYCRKKLGISADAMRNQHPMTVTTALTSAFLADESAHSLDETLWHYARSLGKETTGVETFSDQLDTLHRIPFEQQLKGLAWLLKNYKRQKRRLKKMMEWYAEGNISQLYKAAKKDAKGMRRALLYDRNILMVRRLKEIAREQPLFCAVGAGHLAGQKGMLRLLKKAGFKVKPVAISSPA